MNIKEKLAKPYLMNEKIEYTTNQIKECEMYIERISPYINESGIKGDKTKDNKSECIINLILYKKKLINEINTLYKHKLDVTNLIDSLESELDKLIMKKHYLNYETWSKISEDLSITYQTVHSHHKKSIKTLEGFYEKKKMQ